MCADQDLPAWVVMPLNRQGPAQPGFDRNLRASVGQRASGEMPKEIGRPSDALDGETYASPKRSRCKYRAHFKRSRMSPGPAAQTQSTDWILNWARAVWPLPRWDVAPKALWQFRAWWSG